MRSLGFDARLLASLHPVSLKDQSSSSAAAAEGRKEGGGRNKDKDKDGKNKDQDKDKDKDKVKEAKKCRRGATAGVKKKVSSKFRDVRKVKFLKDFLDCLA